MCASARSANSPLSCRDRFVISTDPADADHGVIASFLASSYWAKNVPYDRIAKSLDSSFAYHLIEKPDDRQIGFARVVSDGVRFAYLCDVFVLEAYRGQGLGAWLIDAVTADPRLADVGRWALATADAQPFYRKLGWHEAEPGRYMVK